MDNQIQGTEKQLAEREYLRNGIPSIVLAIVTAILTAYSYWIVQPNIQDRYRQICEANFEKLELVGAWGGGKGSDLPNQLTSEATPPKAHGVALPLSGEERKSILIDTQLCLRRLAIMDQTDDSVRFESAIVAQALADWYRSQAWDIAIENPRSVEIGALLGGERSEIGKAMDSMRAVQRLKGPLATSASIWMLEKQLMDSQHDSGLELDKLETTARETVGAEIVLGKILAKKGLQFGWDTMRKSSTTASADSVTVADEDVGAVPAEDKNADGDGSVNASGESVGSNTPGASALGSVPNAPGANALGSGSSSPGASALGSGSNTPGASALGSGSNSPGASALGSGERMKVLGDAIDLLERSKADELDTVSWLALAKLPMQPEKAQELAWGAVQDYWTRKSSKKPKAEELDAVLRGLLVGGNQEEAQTFVINELKKLPNFEQLRFRKLVASSCLRQVTAGYLIAQRNSKEKSMSASDNKAILVRWTNDLTLLDLAVRLQPDMRGLSEVLVAIGSSEMNELDGSLPGYVRRVIATGKRDGLMGLCNAVKGAREGEAETIRKALERVCQEDITYGVLATNVVSIMNSEGLPHELTMHWLQSINEFSPDVFAAWFTRGKLHLKAGEKQQAIECFEYLAKRLPDKEQVKEMLEEAQQ